MNEDTKSNNNPLDLVVRKRGSHMATAIISYPFNVGGQLCDRWMWMATIDGDVYDYQSKRSLKRSLTNDGHKWEVHRRHKNGTTSVVERSV